MRRALTWIGTLAFLLVIGVGYAAAPFLTAWRLGDAVRDNDTATIARTIEWESFRASLRRSIMRNADLIPEAKAVARRIRPTLWQRVKRVFGASLVDRFIETNITPEGLPRLYAQAQRKKQRARSVRSWRRARRSGRSSFADRMVARARAGVRPLRPQRAPRVNRASRQTHETTNQDQQTGWRARLRDFVSRVERAEFIDLTTVELQIRDKRRSDRAYVARFELIGLGWKLTTADILTRQIRTPRAHSTGLLASAR
ncbi:MAG: DUF2939 domain-containing protein [Pseudomonadota bacterium]